MGSVEIKDEKYVCTVNDGVYVEDSNRDRKYNDVKVTIPVTKESDKKTKVRLCNCHSAKAVRDLILKEQVVELEAKAFFVDYVNLHTKQYDVFTTFVTESEPFGANYQVDVVEYDLLHRGECPIVRIKKQAR